MRILAITSGASDSGSTRFRLGQYVPYLESCGAHVTTVAKADFTADWLPMVEAADLVINQKCLIGGALGRQIRQRCKRLLFDLDDAIYTRPGKPYGWWTGWRVQRRFHAWLRAADLVVVANQQLQEAVSGTARRVELLPMGIDVACWQPQPRAADGQFRIGWLGAPGNLPFLKNIEPVLGQTLQRFPHVRLSVLCGQRPSLKVPFDYTPFAPDAEAAFVQRLDLGLLPLPDDAHARGKSPIKAIQYLACGVPVVGNVVGAAAEICRPDSSVNVEGPEQWGSALASLAAKPQQCSVMGAAGRGWVHSRHDARVLEQRLWQLIRSL